MLHATKSIAKEVNDMSQLSLKEQVARLKLQIETQYFMKEDDFSPATIAPAKPFKLPFCKNVYIVDKRHPDAKKFVPLYS